MSLILDLDPAHLLSVQAESPEETWANSPDMESDRETVWDVAMEVYRGDELDHQLDGQVRICLV